jgi:hypothetical protein
VLEDSLRQFPGHTGVQRAARHDESETAAFVQVGIFYLTTWAGSGERMQLRILPLRVRMTTVAKDYRRAKMRPEEPDRRFRANRRPSDSRQPVICFPVNQSLTARIRSIRRIPAPGFLAMWALCSFLLK